MWNWPQSTIDMLPPNMSRKLDVITLENLHAEIMDVENCVNDILQKLNVFQERVNTLEMENSNLKRENKKLKCFLDQERRVS